MTFREVFHKAINFQDKHRLPEDRINALLADPVDVTLANTRCPAEEPFGVTYDTRLVDALAFGEFNDVLFDIRRHPKVIYPPLLDVCWLLT